MFGFKKKLTASDVLDIPSPVKGKIIPLIEVPDPAFSGGAMGPGIAVEPDEGRVTAPFDGVVAHLMERSKHAVLLEHASGVQILIHVGTNTVSLKGEGFTAHVQTGDRVRQGQLLLEFDMAAITQAGYSVVTPMIVPGGQDNVKEAIPLLSGDGPEGQAVIRVTLT
ncbi:PTS sugar transporter subunit IIA [Paenibacillus donghaensis]|uniref:PTS glucose transporter subunit IIA n=1 Tax=Paenibacillus donghaensis TaxID=414771 RepID=A0A2Z2KGP1_9BACL|nr:PTS glucose transporter subunit IIA [Paenibacillus donghaensis]ASA19992.1 PTS glucose transporter subunit IIA [Paenibacillus donghaensis]